MGNHWNRRRVLHGLLSGVALSGLACRPASDDDTDANPTDTGEVDPWDFVEGAWEPAGAEALLLFPHGVQVGDVTTASAILSVRTGAVGVAIEVVAIDSAGWQRVFHEVHDPADRAIQLEVSRLQPDTQYGWIARTSPTERSRTGTFRTPPEPGISRVIRFGAVSCLGGNEPWPCLSRAAEEDLDVFLFLGDTVYADWGEPDPIQDKWDQALAQEGMRDLTASTSLIATWDDHEVWNNFSPANTSQAEIDAGRAAFREGLPQRVGPADQIWRELVWGDLVAFFVLDSRGERNGSDYISRDQMDWLKAGLTQSNAQFKIVLNSVPITDLSYIPFVGLIEADDRWQGHPQQRNELVAHCVDIPGVIFVSGDFHVGAAAFIEPDDAPGGSLMEILAGPGGSPVGGAYSAIVEGGRLPRIVAELNYTLFECDPATGEITVSWISNTGEVLSTLSVIP